MTLDNATMDWPSWPRYDKADLQAALESLKRGGIIVYPTDTVWGIGCDATNEEAVARVKALKGRPDAKALITLVSDTAMLERWVEDVPEAALQLVEASLPEEGAEPPRPMTIVYDHPSSALARGLIAPDGSMAVRVCTLPFAAELCRRLRRPIVSTSANFSGSPTPTCFSEINPDLLEKADYVARYLRDDRKGGEPSVIIKVSTGGIFKIIRK
ncbi:MAG: L-threonylcarbamoyladenylate synthase [Pseudoflavonifractor sp.]|nr:L-threonylcarbamoyladenylate synthase [Pseudoflavonifractor sp.]